MPIFEISDFSINRLKTTTFGHAQLHERTHLQRLLRDQIDVVAPSVMIIGEEFGEWTESRLRIDLLGIDKNANIVVIELKRTEDGGHMELQAIRYAAMVSTLTARRAVEIYENYLRNRGFEDDAEQKLLDFLEWEELDEDSFGQDVRIVLVSANFSRELTTSVLWLNNEKEMDITCVRIQPYTYLDNTLIDVQQVIPLTEASDYQVSVREKKRQERASRSSNIDFTRYDIEVNGKVYRKQWKRNSILLVVKALHESGIKMNEIMQLFKRLRRGNAFIILDQEISDADQIAESARQYLEDQGRALNIRRWHIGEEDIIQENGKTYLMTKMWGKHWPTFMETIQKEFPQINLKYYPSSHE